MDDLFQNLGTPGRGTHSRNRPGTEMNVAQGAAFGAAFESLPADEDEWTILDRHSGLAADVHVGKRLGTAQGQDPLRDQPPIAPNEGDVTDAMFTTQPGIVNTTPLIGGQPEDPSVSNMVIAAQLTTVEAGGVADISDQRASVGLVITPGHATVGMGPLGQTSRLAMPVIERNAGDPSALPTATHNETRYTSTPSGPGAVPVERIGTLASPPTITSVEGKTAQTTPLTVPSSDGVTIPLSLRGTENTPRPTSALAARTGSQDQMSILPASNSFAPQPTGSNGTNAIGTPDQRAAPALAPTARDTLPKIGGAEQASTQTPLLTDAKGMPHSPLTAQMREANPPSDARSTDALTPPRTTVPQPPQSSPPGSLVSAASMSASGDPDPESIFDKNHAELPRSGDSAPARTGSWAITPATAAAPVISAPMQSILSPMSGLSTMPMHPDISADPLADLDFSVQSLSATSTTAAPPSASIFAQASSATAQVVAQQVAAALSKGNPASDAPLELALDPPELGRLRMQITEIAGVMTLMIQAERPETADLVRRHLELLAREFAQEGLDAPSVHVSQEGAGDGRQHLPGDSADAAAPSTVDDPTDASPPEIGRAARSGLDLRL
ncbi:flagellar hook-length control protein FliK [Jannaschia sp. CCS1]|uniref:flagellar hook-length control protein FliK n=1 Tax=Jannaschia sp. (strain CCS1) TaxID=290400 RepID=UPI000053C3E1|nr:flagellar hook-length control protein FliK [Jannaschia sp. CCS1]ABD57123.1 Zonadhesin precursor [Jannaschia sp. CCS1]